MTEVTAAPGGLPASALFRPLSQAATASSTLSLAFVFCSRGFTCSASEHGTRLGFHYLRRSQVAPKTLGWASLKARS